MTPKPEKVRVLLARMKRKGVSIALVDGLVQVDGWRRLPPEERDALRGDRERIVAWLMARELKRQRREERQRKQQQESKAIAQHQQRQRKVVGQVVNPGGPLRLLFADECKDIDLQRARVLGTVPYGRSEVSDERDDDSGPV